MFYFIDYFYDDIMVVEQYEFAFYQILQKFCSFFKTQLLYYIYVLKLSFGKTTYFFL